MDGKFLARPSGSTYYNTPPSSQNPTMAFSFSEILVEGLHPNGLASQLHVPEHVPSSASERHPFDPI